MNTPPTTTGSAGTMPERPPNSRIIVVRDDDGLTVVIPPRIGWTAVAWFVLSGVFFLLALYFLAEFAMTLLPIPPLRAPGRDALNGLLCGLGQMAVGLGYLGQALTALKQWTRLTIHGDELEVRRGRLWRDARVRLPRGKVARIYVELLAGRTAILRIVGKQVIDITGASEAEFQWLAWLLWQALEQKDAAPAARAADCALPVDEITSKPSQIRRS